MEGNFTGKEFYRQHFDPKCYLNVYMPVGSGESSVHETLFAFILEKLHKAFVLDGIRGETLIDIGSGPSIYQLLSACESFQEIVATDYADQNREEMQRWLKKDPEAFDWTSMVKYVGQLEGDREKWVDKGEKLRSTVRRVLKCDVTLANPLDPLVVRPAGCVLSTFCLEAACRDLPAYRSAVKNVGSLVKPGGHLIFVVALEETYYTVGQHEFSCLYLTRKMVEDAVKEAGFAAVCCETVDMNLPLAATDGQRVGFIVAQKCIKA